MQIKNYFFTICIGMGFALVSYAQSSTDDTVNKHDFFLVIGQSNMAGRGEMKIRDSKPSTFINLFSDSGWVSGSHPYNRYSNIRKGSDIQQFGLIESFSRLLKRKGKFTEVNLLVNARGGSSIRQWLPGKSYLEKTKERLQEALKYGSCLGIIWHQGESDRKNTQQYLDNLSIVVKELRKLTGPETPFVAGQLANWKDNSGPFNEMILKVPKVIKNSGVVELIRPYNHVGDSIHFDRRSLKKIGKLYAEKFLSL